MEFTNDSHDSSNNNHNDTTNTLLSVLEKNQHANREIMCLKIFVDSNDTELVNIYKNAAEKHNNKMLSDIFPDAGFDLYAPDDISASPGKLNKIDFKVKCSAKMVSSTSYVIKEYNTGFYMYPRSSLSGTKLRLANSVGIIDSGYRGHLIGAFDCLPSSSSNSSFDSNNYTVIKHTRLVQICSPSLSPIHITIVDYEADVNDNTSRGSGGFGSTGV
jgi:dUTP pyrophosphatase